MKKFILIIIYSSLYFGCNMSDDSVKLPGGHLWIIEGNCTNRIIVNIPKSSPIIEYVKDCKYNDNFVVVLSSDEESCKNKTLVDSTKRYFIINNFTKTIIGPMNKEKYSIIFKTTVKDMDLFFD